MIMIAITILAVYTVLNGKDASTPTVTLVILAPRIADRHINQATVCDNQGG